MKRGMNTKKQVSMRLKGERENTLRKILKRERERKIKWENKNKENERGFCGESSKWKISQFFPPHSHSHSSFVLYMNEKFILV